MSANRIGRGFHRLGVFLAAIPLLVGGIVSISWSLDHANRMQRYHNEALELVCAKEWLKATPAPSVPGLPPGFRLDDEEHDLKSLGCSKTSRKVVVSEIYDASAPADFSYTSELLPPLIGRHQGIGGGSNADSC